MHFFGGSTKMILPGLESVPCVRVNVWELDVEGKIQKHYSSSACFAQSFLDDKPNGVVTQISQFSRVPDSI